MPAPLNDTPTEFRIVSTEFRYPPAKVWVKAGRPVTLVLDNSGAETEHGVMLPAFGFRLMAKAGEITRSGNEGHADRQHSLKTINLLSFFPISEWLPPLLQYASGLNRSQYILASPCVHTGTRRVGA
jgi:hypothetical protein